MTGIEKPKRKNKIQKRRVIGLGKNGFEDCIYYNLKHGSHFDVLVSMRIGNKQLQRKKKNLKFITEAKKFRTKFIEELKSIKAENNRGDMFWSQALEMYLANLKSLVETEQMSESTYLTRETTLKAHTTNWASMKLSDFHQLFIRQFIFDKLKSKTPETKKNILKFVRQVFNFQISIGNKILKFNPAAGISSGKKTENKPVTISKIDMKRIIDHAHETNDEWAPIYFLAYMWGCRSGELYALKWSDINWSEKNITIGKSYCWKSKKEKAPKNDKHRVLPFNKSTYSYLENYSKISNDSLYILPRISSWKNGGAAKNLKEIQGRLNIPKTNFHSIRSTFITQLLLKGEPAVKVSKLAGHSTYQTTEIYVRLVAKDLIGTTSALEFDIDEGEPPKVIPIEKKSA